MCLCATVDSGALKAAQVTQLDRDTVLVALERKSLPLRRIQLSLWFTEDLYLYLGACRTETVKVVNLQGLPSKELAAELVFGFSIETLGKEKIPLNETSHHLMAVNWLNLF